MKVRGSVEGLNSLENEGILKHSICRENADIYEVKLVNNELLVYGRCLGKFSSDLVIEWPSLE